MLMTRVLMVINHVDYEDDDHADHDDDVDGDDDAVDGWGRELSHLVCWNHQQDHDQNVDNDGGGDDDDAVEAAADDDDAVERDLANWCIRMTQLGRHLKIPH